MSKKKLVSILLSAVLCFGMLGSTFSASAASVSVHLTKNQAVNSSSKVYGTFKYFWGTNSKSSQHSVHYIARYKTDWFLKLNPEGNNTTGCDAWGYMKNA